MIDGEAPIIEAPMEGAPTDDQKERLEDWLTELLIVCRKYNILLSSHDGEIRIIDLDRATVIGVDLTYIVVDERITSYDATMSVLDGAWLIETPDGLQEQSVAGRIWPRRSEEGA